MIDTHSIRCDHLVTSTNVAECQSRKYKNILEEMIKDETKMYNSQEQQKQHLNLIRYQPLRAWRDRVIQWCYDVVDEARESRSIVYIAIHIIDRYCAFKANNDENVDERLYELYSVAALFLAGRIKGSQKFDLGYLSTLTRTSFHVNDISSTGKHIVQCLTWTKRFLTPFDFVKAYVAILPPTFNSTMRNIIINDAAYFCEVSISDFHLTHTRASATAIAAVINAIEAKCNTSLSSNVSTGRSSKLRHNCARLKHICNEVQRGERVNGYHIIPDESSDGELSMLTIPLRAEQQGLVHTISVEDIELPQPQLGSKRKHCEAQCHRKSSRMQ